MAFYVNVIYIYFITSLLLFCYGMKKRDLAYHFITTQNFGCKMICIKRTFLTDVLCLKIIKKNKIKVLYA